MDKGFNRARNLTCVDLDPALEGAFDEIASAADSLEALYLAWGQWLFKNDREHLGVVPTALSVRAGFSFPPLLACCDAVGVDEVASKNDLLKLGQRLREKKVMSASQNRTPRVAAPFRWPGRCATSSATQTQKRRSFKPSNATLTTPLPADARGPHAWAVVGP